MDIFEVSILKISRVQHGKRGVFVGNDRRNPVFL